MIKNLEVLSENEIEKKYSLERGIISKCYANRYHIDFFEPHTIFEKDGVVFITKREVERIFELKTPLVPIKFLFNEKCKVWEVDYNFIKDHVAQELENETIKEVVYGVLRDYKSMKNMKKRTEVIITNDDIENAINEYYKGIKKGINKYVRGYFKPFAYWIYHHITFKVSEEFTESGYIYKPIDHKETETGLLLAKKIAKFEEELEEKLGRYYRVFFSYTWNE